MKKYVFYFFVVFISFSCKKKDNNSLNEKNCDVSSYIRDNYTYDAKFLIYNDIFRDSSVHPNYNLPYFDSLEVEKRLQAIQAVYDLHSPQSDSIFNLYKIHMYSFYSLNKIHIYADSGSIEIRNLTKKLPTGDLTFDSIMNLFQFQSIDTGFRHPNLYFVSTNIETPLSLNMIPILNKINQLPFILSATNNVFGGTGSIIQYYKENNEDILKFSYGFGDCPSGCTDYYVWEFKIKDCTATFSKRY